MLLIPGASIHTGLMTHVIDVVFLSGEWEVLRVRRGLRPWRAGMAPRGTKMTLELAAGAASPLRIGNILQGGSDRDGHVVFN